MKSTNKSLYPHFRFDAAGNIVADTERGVVLIVRRDQVPKHFAPCATIERPHDVEAVEATDTRGNDSAEDADEIHPSCRASTTSQYL
jgi:hypothetical protein